MQAPTVHTTPVRPSLARAACSIALLGLALGWPSSASALPLLPDLPGPDIRDQQHIIIHLDRSEPLVEVDGQLRALGQRPLELAADEIDDITLLFVLPYGAELFISENGEWMDTLDGSAVSNMLAYDLRNRTSGESVVFGFEVGLPAQPGPTVPMIIVRPTEDDPDPN